MARILRRRVAQMPKVASSRRNLASEINQYLKLGMTAQQIIEKMIPDDPSITPEMMDPIFDMMARRQGATAPLAERAAGVQRIAGSMVGQTPAIPVVQPSSEVPKSPSQGLGAPPASSPGAAAPLKPEQLPPRATGQRLAAIQQTSPVTDLIDQAARIAATNADFAEIDEFKDLRDEIAIIFNDEFDSQNMYGDADVAIAETVQKLRDESVALPPPEPVPEPKATAKATAKAKVSQSIQKAQIADNAEQLKSSFRQMYNAIKEGSGMYDFADNVQRAVPLFFRAAQASKASGDDVRLLQTLIRKSVREAELADKQAGRAFRQAENQKNREARADNIEKRAVLKKEYLVAKDESDREFAEFKKGLRVDLEKILQKNRLDVLSRKQKNRERTQSSKVLLSLLTQKPRKTPATQAQKDFAVQKKEEIKALNDYEAGIERLEALVAATDDLGILLADDIDLDEAEVKRKQAILSQRAIVDRRRLAHMGVLERMREAAGQDPELLNAIPEEMPEYDYSVLLQPSDEAEVGSDDVDAESIVNDANRRPPASSYFGE